MIKATATHDFKSVLWYTYHQMFKKRLILILLLIANVLFGVLAVLNVLNGDPVTKRLFPIFIVDSLVILLYGIFPIIIAKMAAQAESQISLEFNDENISYTASNTRGEESGFCCYPSIVSVERGSRAYYLFMSKHEAIIVTRAGIENATEAEFEQMLARNIGKNKIKFTIQE